MSGQAKCVSVWCGWDLVFERSGEGFAQVRRVERFEEGFGVFGQNRQTHECALALELVAVRQLFLRTLHLQTNATARISPHSSRHTHVQR